MLAALVSPLVALLLIVPTQVTTSLEEVGRELRQDPVYVDPQAERALDESEAQQLRAQIRDAGTPIYVAVLPASAAESPDAALQEVQSASGLSGTYVGVIGDSFRVTSTGVQDADSIAGAVFQRHRDAGTFAVLEAFIGAVSATARGGGDRESTGGGDDGGSLFPLALLAGGGVALFAWSRRRGRERDRLVQREFDADVQLLRAELSVLADDVMRLEPQVVTQPEARADYEAATTRFRAASAALDYADEPVDLVRVERVVREAEYAMSRARAIIDGREPPAPPADLQRPGRHEEPALEVDATGRPVYVGAGTFYGGGWFGGGGGLFSGLLLGSMLGGWGPFGWGGGWHHGGDGAGGGDWGGGFGGGDWGGGGDIGGGDW